MNLYYTKVVKAKQSWTSCSISGRGYGIFEITLTSLVLRQLLHIHTHRTYLLQTSSKKSLTVFSCLLQKSFWKLFFIQSSVLHTLTLSEYQQMDKCFKAGPRRKLSFFRSTGEWKFNKDHSKGSWNTSSNLRHVFPRFFLLFLSRKEKRCKRHSRFSWVMCIAWQRLLDSRRNSSAGGSLRSPGAYWTYMVVEWGLFLANSWCRSSEQGKEKNHGCSLCFFCPRKWNGHVQFDCHEMLP